MSDDMAELRERIAKLEVIVEGMAASVDKQAAAVGQLVAKFNEVKGGWRLIAWVAGLGGSAAGVLHWLGGHIVLK